MIYEEWLAEFDNGENPFPFTLSLTTRRKRYLNQIIIALATGIRAPEEEEEALFAPGWQWREENLFFDPELDSLDQALECAINLAIFGE